MTTPDQSEIERESSGERTCDMLQRLGMDGHKWAKEFIKMWNGRVVGYGEVDEGLMIGWFCNAIMQGYDTATHRQEAKYKRLVKAAREAVTDTKQLQGTLPYSTWEELDQALKELETLIAGHMEPMRPLLNEWSKL